MAGTGIGTSLLMIAIGAILAMAVNYSVSGVDIKAIGAILIVVGALGLLISMVFMMGIIGAHSDEGHHTVDHY